MKYPAKEQFIRIQTGLFFTIELSLNWIHGENKRNYRYDKFTEHNTKQKALHNINHAKQINANALLCDLFLIVKCDKKSMFFNILSFSLGFPLIRAREITIDQYSPQSIIIRLAFSSYTINTIAF